MKKIERLIFCIILVALAYFVCGCESDNIPPYPGPNEPQDIERDIKEGDLIEQIHLRLWGKIPKQNLCPHCGETSYTRFCTDCKKDRGNLPFIGVYCPKCNPDGKYAGKTDDVTKICGDCGSAKAWKYVYEDWQSEPNEPQIYFKD